VSLDAEEEEAPKSLWPGAKAKKSAAAKSDSKEAAEPPKVDTALDEAMRAAGKK
jgi:hypothetical protein